MLAATPKSPSRASLFRLVLSLSSHRENPPPTLIKYFDVVLDQAKLLSITPNRLDGEIDPEAIDLAFEIKSNKNFSKEIMRVESYTALTPILAAALLSQLERSSVY